MGGGVFDDQRKALARMVQHPGRTISARHGEGARGCTPWGGDIGGGRERQEQERKRGRHDEAKRIGVA